MSGCTTVTLYVKTVLATLWQHYEFALTHSLTHSLIHSLLLLSLHTFDSQTLTQVKTVLATLWQHYDFAVDTSKTPLPPLLRPGITLGYREGVHFTVTPRV